MYRYLEWRLKIAAWNFGWRLGEKGAEAAWNRYHGNKKRRPRPRGSFKISTFVFIVAGATIPPWFLSMPLFWLLALGSYQKPKKAALQSGSPAEGVQKQRVAAVQRTAKPVERVQQAQQSTAAPAGVPAPTRNRLGQFEVRLRRWAKANPWGLFREYVELAAKSKPQVRELSDEKLHEIYRKLFADGGVRVLEEVIKYLNAMRRKDPEEYGKFQKTFTSVHLGPEELQGTSVAATSQTVKGLGQIRPQQVAKVANGQVGGSSPKNDLLLRLSTAINQMGLDRQRKEVRATPSPQAARPNNRADDFMVRFPQWARANPGIVMREYLSLVCALDPSFREKLNSWSAEDVLDFYEMMRAKSLDRVVEEFVKVLEEMRQGDPASYRQAVEDFDRTYSVTGTRYGP